MAQEDMNGDQIRSEKRGGGMREVGEGGLREICQTMSVISAEIIINSRLEFPFMKMPKLLGHISVKYNLSTWLVYR